MDFFEVTSELRRWASEPGPYLEGRVARARGEPITACPYRPWPTAHPYLGTCYSRWYSGWRHEDAELRALLPCS